MTMTRLGGHEPCGKQEPHDEHEWFDDPPAIRHWCAGWVRGGLLSPDFDGLVQRVADRAFAARVAHEHVDTGRLTFVASGKVRDIYADGPHLVLVASDRVSVYDHVLPTEIPDKGEVLTRLSNWWCFQLSDMVPNHVVSSTWVPEAFLGRAVRVEKLSMIPVECIVRGALTGSAWVEYEQHGSIGGRRALPGLAPGAVLPVPMFTPTTKAAPGEHDRPLTHKGLIDEVSAPVAAILEAVSLKIFERASDMCQKVGLILADTKFEFGFNAQGNIVLADEVLTPDSSRFWDIQQWSPGKIPPPYDKQFVRNYVDSINWSRTPPAPCLPPDVIKGTQVRYIEVFERITGCEFRKVP